MQRRGADGGRRVRLQPLLPISQTAAQHHTWSSSRHDEHAASCNQPSKQPLGEGFELAPHLEDEPAPCKDDLDLEDVSSCSRHAFRSCWSHLVRGASGCLQEPKSGGGGSSVAQEPGRKAQGRHAPSCAAGLRQLACAVLWDIIHPDSRFRTLWESLIVALLVYVALVMPYVIGFDVRYDTKSVLGVTELVINGFFFLDIFINFRTALRKGEYIAGRADVITDRGTIARVYLSGWFALDLMAALPWKEMVSSLGAYLQLAKVPRLLQLARLLRLIKLVKAVRASRMYRHVERRQGVAAPRVLLYALCAVLALHLGACAWAFAALVESERLADTWVDTAGLVGASKSELYVSSLYFVVLTFTTVGYGDIYPVTTAERVLACVLITMGVVTLSYIIFTANAILSQSNKYETSCAETQARLSEFLAGRPLPWALDARVKRYYHHVAQRQFNHPGDTDMIQSLPSDLRHSVLRELHAGLLRRVPLLRAAGRLKEGLVLDLAAALKLEVFRSGECVVLEGGWDSELYLVLKGRLAVRQYTNRAAAMIAATLPAPGAMQEDAYESLLAGAETGGQAAVALSRSQQAAARPAGCESSVVSGVEDGGGDKGSSRTTAAGCCPGSQPASASQPKTEQQPDFGVGDDLGAQNGEYALSSGLDDDKSRSLGEAVPATSCSLSRPMGRPQAPLSTLDEVFTEPGSASPCKGALAAAPIAMDADIGVQPQGEETSQCTARWQVRYNPKMPYRHLCMLTPGRCFGEYGCLLSCPRTASVVARQVSELLVLARRDLRAAMAAWPHTSSAWKECEAYGNRERARLRRQLHGGGHAAGLAPGGEEEEALSSERRYQDFLRFVQSVGA